MVLPIVTAPGTLGAGHAVRRVDRLHRVPENLVHILATWLSYVLCSDLCRPIRAQTQDGVVRFIQDDS